MYIIYRERELHSLPIVLPHISPTSLPPSKPRFHSPPRPPNPGPPQWKPQNLQPFSARWLGPGYWYYTWWFIPLTK